MLGPVPLSLFCLAPCHISFAWSRATFLLVRPCTTFFFTWPRATFFSSAPCHISLLGPVPLSFVHLPPCHSPLSFGPVSHFFAWPRVIFLSIRLSTNFLLVRPRVTHFLCLAPCHNQFSWPRTTIFFLGQCHNPYWPLCHNSFLGLAS